MSFATLLYQKTAPLAEIRFNRPDRLNALIKAMYDDIFAALADAEQDRQIRVVMLSGVGDAFCVGLDDEERAQDWPSVQQREYWRGRQSVCRRIYSLNKPVIAAVNGLALGAGAELAIAADFMLMAESAQFGFPAVSTGASIGGGASHILPQLVGLAKARELVLLGRLIGAAEAVAIGLANQVIPDHEFSERVHAFAEELAAKAPLSIALAKEHLNTAMQLGMDAVLVTELEGMMFCSTTQDWREGVRALAEKRRPQFKGE